MTAGPLEIERVPIPQSLTDPNAGDFLDGVELGNLIRRHVWGSDDFRRSDRQELVASQPTPYEERIILGARRGGRLLGRALAAVPLTDNLTSCYVDLGVHPESRSQGIGAALYAEAERYARSLGRSTLMGWSEVPVDGAGAQEDGLVPATGAGRHPRSDPAAAMAASRGFTLAQVDRASVLHVQDAAPADARSAAAAAAGPDYTVVQWEGHCPDVHIDSYVELCRAMSTDAPMGDLDLEEEVWDAGRVREAEDRLARSGGRSLVSAALHVPSGRLAGHTVLEQYEASPAVSYQEDTLVLREHRGHRLGMLLKSANLLAAATAWPRVERIYTWNAVENSPMLAVNIELGFVPAGSVAAWQKRFDQPG
jgi:GNAT superfamily N-acetyltransferase